MPSEDAAPVIFFIVSLYAFAIVLLYVLARAWEQALSTRTTKSGLPPGRSDRIWSAERRAVRMDGQIETINIKTNCEQTDK
jgi:hypothetical protein